MKQIYVPFICAIIISIIALLFVQIDSKLFDSDIKTSSYIKISLLCGSLSGFVCYFMKHFTETNIQTKQTEIDVSIPVKTAYVDANKIPPGEIILTGDPTM